MCKRKVGFASFCMDKNLIYNFVLGMERVVGKGKETEKEGGWNSGISSPRQEVSNFVPMAGLGNGIREGSAESHGRRLGNVLKIWV